MKSRRGLRRGAMLLALPALLAVASAPLLAETREDSRFTFRTELRQELGVYTDDFDVQIYLQYHWGCVSTD